MIHFEDGPAAGQIMMLRRAPVFLRVVHLPEAEGTERAWDALDSIQDKPKPGEVLYAYRRAGRPGSVRFCCGRKGDLHGRYAMARYRVVETQPAQEVMQDNKTWRLWAQEQAQLRNQERLEGCFDMSCPRCKKTVRWQGRFRSWPACPHCKHRPDPAVVFEFERLMIESRKKDEDPATTARLEARLIEQERAALARWPEFKDILKNQGRLHLHEKETP